MNDRQRVIAEAITELDPAVANMMRHVVEDAALMIDLRLGQWEERILGALKANVDRVFANEATEQDPPGVEYWRYGYMSAIDDVALRVLVPQPRAYD